MPHSIISLLSFCALGMVAMPMMKFPVFKTKVPNGDTPIGPEHKLIVNGQEFQPGSEGLYKLAALKAKLLSTNGMVDVDGSQYPVSHPLADQLLFKTELQLKFPNLTDAQLTKALNAYSNAGTGTDITTKVKATNADGGDRGDGDNGQGQVRNPQQDQRIQHRGDYSQTDKPGGKPGAGKVQSSDDARLKGNEHQTGKFQKAPTSRGPRPTGLRN